LKIVLQKIDKADAVIIGIPIYWGEVTGMTRSFYERFMFQVTNYKGDPFIDREKKLKVDCVYTVNGPRGYMDKLLNQYQQLYSIYYDYVGIATANETLQANDYSKFYVGDAVEGAHKKQLHETVFPEDMKQAYELGTKVCQA
jgi:multimeric flavodoxin WrbA